LPGPWPRPTAPNSPETTHAPGKAASVQTGALQRRRSDGGAAVGVAGNTVNVYNGTSHVALEDSNRVGVPGSDSQVDGSASAHLLCLER
jgi:hypothetical protein